MKYIIEDSNPFISIPLKNLKPGVPFVLNDGANSGTPDVYIIVKSADWISQNQFPRMYCLLETGFLLSNITVQENEYVFPVKAVYADPSGTISFRKITVDEDFNAEDYRIEK